MSLELRLHFPASGSPSLLFKLSRSSFGHDYYKSINFLKGCSIYCTIRIIELMYLYSISTGIRLIVNWNASMPRQKAGNAPNWSDALK